jgi:hypothetical protein
MKAKALFCVFLIVLTATPILAQNTEVEKQSAHFSAGLILGYNSGMKFQGYGMVSNFAENFPMNARLSVGYSIVQPGDASAARRIFINNATNGIPEDKGRVLDLCLDLMYPVELLSIDRAFLFGGPRYSRFKGNFKYVGGNEDFDVTSNHWGIGSGIESYFRMSRRVDLVISAGIDYFFESTLTGHDTSYSPDGEEVNGREDYTYDDADDAIEQPKIEPILMFGFSYNF